MDVKVDLSNMVKLGIEFPKASARALNKTMQHARTQLVKDAGQRYKVKAADLKNSMGSQRSATATNLRASFRSKGRRLALTYFMTAAAIMRSLQQKGKAIKQRAVITVEVVRGGKQRILHAFAAQVKAGKEGTHQGIFMREGKDSLPIKQLTGPAPSQMLAGAFKRMTGIKEYLQQTLAHEIDFFRSKQ